MCIPGVVVTASCHIEPVERLQDPLISEYPVSSLSESERDAKPGFQIPHPLTQTKSMGVTGQIWAYLQLGCPTSLMT